MTELKLYNTLTRKKEEFKPISKKQIGMYSCGPTVYSYAHVGNLRTYIFSDLLKRVLMYNGYKVKHVINVTDVGHLTSDSDEGEDKMMRGLKKEGMEISLESMKKLGEKYLKAFREDFRKLNILEPDFWPKASEHIPEQIKLIESLERKKFVYRTGDGLYFDSVKFKNYGKLAKLNIEGLKEGKRISKGEKKNKTDFALWKFNDSFGWGSPWGKGFPGWHLECSAMSMKYLGEHFDIHTGGEDLISTHHTNEIAQSESATGKKFVNYWLHGAFLKFGGKKVSKSDGGLYTVSELEEKGYSPIDFRYLCLMTHYRKSLNFSLENLDAARNASQRMERKIVELRRQEHKGSDFTQEFSERFLEAVNDDLNIPKALDVVWRVLDEFDFDSKKKAKLLEGFDNILGLGIKEMKSKDVELPGELKELLKQRERLRKEKKYAEADLLREKIRNLGYNVEDKN